MKNLFITLLFICHVYTLDAQNPCATNVTNSGAVSGNQIGSSTGYDPGLIQNVLVASGGSGSISYKWQKTLVPYNGVSATHNWQDIPGAVSIDFDPSPITKTTYYRRLAKTSSCSDWVVCGSIVTKTVSSAPVNSCLVYGVQDQSIADFSQFFTVDVFGNNSVSALGSNHEGWDVEAMEIDPTTGILYATSGNDNNHGCDGCFYSVDAQNGNLNIIGKTNYDDVVSLATHPTNNSLFAWVDDFGLITIDKSSGAGTMIYPSTLDFDGMAFSNNGQLLYVATDNGELFELDYIDGTLTLLSDSLPGPVESLEMRPDDLLMFGTHLSSTTIYVLDPSNMQLIDSLLINTPYNDIESLVWPDNCGFSIMTNVSITPVSCHGLSNGSASVYVTQGAPPLSFIWSNGASTSSISGLVAGTYTLTINDANGMSDTLSVTIPQPNALNVTLPKMDPTCLGLKADGSITSIVSGGIGPYSYNWSTGDTTPSISGLIHGNYGLTITDKNNCQLVSYKTIPNICCNFNNGGIIDTDQESCGPFTADPLTNVVYPSGGLGNHEYLWMVSDTNVGYTDTSPFWSSVPNSNTSDLNLGWVDQNKYYVRLSRANGCLDYAVKSNKVEINIVHNHNAQIQYALGYCASNTGELLEAALGFNVFIKDDAIIKGHETEGNMAVGGKLTVEGTYTIAGHTPGTYFDGLDANPSALVVGGKLDLKSGSGINVVNNGFVKICDVNGIAIRDWDNQNNQPWNTRITRSIGNYNSNPRINLSVHQSAASIQKCPIDFEAAFLELENVSKSLAECSPNVNLINTGPQRYSITLAANTKNVLDFDWNAFKEINELKFTNKPTASQPLIINVSGEHIGHVHYEINWDVPNMPGIGDQEGQYIIWNFHKATKVKMKGAGAFKGTFLGPLAELDDDCNGNIDGQVIARQLNHKKGEMHHYLFKPNIDGCQSQGCVFTTADSIEACGGQIVTLRARGGDSYFWSTGDTSSTINVTTGVYSVSISNFGGCVTIKTFEVYCNTIVNESRNYVLNEFTVYPNPSNGNFTTLLKMNKSSSISLQLFDLTGSQIKKLFTGQADQGVLIELDANMSNLANGVYMLILESPEERYTHRIIINR